MDALDQKLNALRPGESIEVSRVGDKYVTAERTGDGKEIKFVRHTPEGWTVFHTSSRWTPHA